MWSAEIEPLLFKCIVAMSMQTNGIVIDAGANDGSGTLRLAESLPNHTILALEPIRTNYKRLALLLRDNVEVLWGGLSDRTSMLTYSKELERGPGLASQTNEIDLRHTMNDKRHVSFPAYTVDELIFEKDRRLVFAHLEFTIWSKAVA